MILNALVPAGSTYAGEIDRLFDVITLLVGELKRQVVMLKRLSKLSGLPVQQTRKQFAF